MSKDPAFLFYSNDFLTGTFTMTDKQVGQYIRLMCLQHQQGHLTEGKIISVCKKRDETILSKFVQDENGLYYNVRLEKEIVKRNAFCESRRSNKAKKEKNVCSSYVDDIKEHMSPHMENENIDINNNNNYISTPKDSENEEIKDARATDFGKVVAYYQDKIGTMLSSRAMTEIPEYIEALSADVVICAIDRAVDGNKRSWSYIRAILQNWKNAEVKSLSDVENIDARRKPSTLPRSAPDYSKGSAAVMRDDSALLKKLLTTPRDDSQRLKEKYAAMERGGVT